jgi:hypothetical protein
MPTLSIVDLASCRINASALTANAVSTGTGLSVIPGGGAFASSNTSVVRLLATAAIVQEFGESGANGCIYDQSNGNVIVTQAVGSSAIAVATLNTAWGPVTGIVGDIDRNGHVALVNNSGSQITINSLTSGSVIATAAMNSPLNCRFDAAGNLYAWSATVVQKFNSALASQWAVSLAGTISALSVGDVSVWVEVDSGDLRSVLKLNPATGATINTTPNVVAPCAIPGDMAAAIQIAFGIFGPQACVIYSNGSVGRVGDFVPAYAGINGSAIGGIQWAANTFYNLNFIVTPTIPNGHGYRCSTQGNSGLAEPHWPTGTGSTVTDGTVVWTEDATIVATNGLTISEPGIGRIGAYAW